MKKLQETVTQSLANFDERLVKLFQQKIKTEMAINQVCLRYYMDTHTHTCTCDMYMYLCMHVCVCIHVCNNSLLVFYVRM